MEPPLYIQSLAARARHQGFDLTAIRWKRDFDDDHLFWIVYAENSLPGAISCRWVAEHLYAPPSGDPNP